VKEGFPDRVKAALFSTIFPLAPNAYTENNNSLYAQYVRNKKSSHCIVLPILHTVLFILCNNTKVPISTYFIVTILNIVGVSP
jgi:hypothetical protein